MAVSSRTGRLLVAALAAVAVCLGLSPGGPARAAGSEPAASAVVAVDATQNLGTVQKAVLGHAYLWPFGGMGSYDEQGGSFYPAFANQLTSLVRPGSLRYPGGIAGEAFHWQRAVGPQSQRTPNAFGPASGPSESSVGPDEFGQLLDRTGADGIVTADFGTGSAQEAAAFVEYMTGAPGSSTWADLRVRNGHRAPYDTPYWEVGNEEYSANYWRTGTPVTVGGPAGACQSVATCLYIYGGSTRFTRQAAVGYADRTAAASHSTGAANQDFYVAYPPVAAGTNTVYVDGAPWTQVTDLGAAGPDAKVYAVDNSSGKISFGDGVHGAVPPDGAQITVSYVSGPHDGFVDFYRAMKAANPHISVCSTDSTNDFIESMGSSLPYDCLQNHTYTSAATAANNVPITEYQDQMIAGADNEATGVAQRQATIRSNAGRTIPLVETEYGQLLNSNPDGYPYYHESLDEALINASQLANWIDLGLPVADRQLLTGEIPPPDRCCAGLPGAAPYASTAAIGTPGPDTVPEATGELYTLFAPLAGGTRLGVQMLSDPSLHAAAAAAVRVVAVRRAGATYLLAINRSTSSDVDTRVLLRGAQVSGPATFTRLDGQSALSYNTAESSSVGITHGRTAASGSDLELSLPAHSVTTLRLPVRPVDPPSLSLGLSPDSGVAAPGGQVSLQATVSNTGRQPVQAQVTPLVPAGWAVQPTTASTLVGPGEKRTVTLHLTVPADTAEQEYQLGATVTGPGGAVADATATSVIVRHLESWTTVASDDFDGQQAGAPPGDYAITGSTGAITVQPSPSGSGQVLRLQRADATTGYVAADRTVTPISGPTRFMFRAWADQTDTALGVQLLDEQNTPVVKLSLATAGDISYNNGTTFVRGASYTARQWDTYEVDLDPASGTYKLYIDDVLVATPALNTAAGSVADIHLQLPASPATPGTFDIDDVSLAVPTS